MSEDNRGCGSTVAGGVVICAIIFNWFGAGELASGIFQGAGNIAARIARGLSSGSSAPSAQPTPPNSNYIDQRLVGRWTPPDGFEQTMTMSLGPGGTGWHFEYVTSNGQVYSESGSIWFCEGASVVLVDSSKSRSVGSVNLNTGVKTTLQEPWSGRRTIRCGFDSLGRLVFGQGDGMTLTLTRSN